LQRALEAADRAIALAPDEPDGYAARGELRFTYFWNWTGGREDIEKAMSYDVGNSTTQIRYSELLAGLGQLPQAIAAARKAVDADPLSATAWKALGKWLMNDRQFAAARQAFSRSEQINPDSVMPRWYLSETDLLDGKDQEALARTRSLRPDGALYVTALASYTLGRRTEAQQALDDYISRYSQTSAYQIAVIHAWRGETGKVFEWLDRSYAQHDSGLLWFKIDPFLSSIRADPRYGAMLKKLNLPE
jgi:tetratricopeptide (TPR) repeat protein